MSEKPKHGRVYKDYLNDIRTSIMEILEFTDGMDFDEFLIDRRTSHAVIRCFEIIGEAVKKIPDELKAKYSVIPWREIAGMRDKMIHEYFGVNLTIVWQTIEDDVPLLDAMIRKMVMEEDEPSGKKDGCEKHTLV